MNIRTSASRDRVRWRHAPGSAHAAALEQALGGRRRCRPRETQASRRQRIARRAGVSAYWQRAVAPRLAARIGARGRALFDVAHDPSRPFVVRTGTAEATALDTRFTVETLDGRSRVAVLQSRVAVRCVSCEVVFTPRVLSPHNEADVSMAGVSASRVADTAATAGWEQGTLTFENVNLRDALAELQRYTHRRIWLADGKAGERRVSAVVNPQDPTTATRLLAAAAKLDVRAVPGMLLVGIPEDIISNR